MMLCVISYWVLSGAKRRQIQQLRCCVLPTKLLKRRDVYLKLTRHNGRAGTHGTYNPKHNDRSFNLANSEHIDSERAKGNIYWDCFHGFRSALDPQDPDDLAATFSDVERQFYETHYTAFIENQNERNAKIRHTERNRSISDLLSSRKTCPEETIYQLGTLDEHASAEDLLSVVTEFIEKFKAKYPHRCQRKPLSSHPGLPERPAMGRHGTDSPRPAPLPRCCGGRVHLRNDENFSAGSHQAGVPAGM